MLHKFESKQSSIELVGPFCIQSNQTRTKLRVLPLALEVSVKELHYHVKLNVECRQDMAVWLRFLSEWNGVALFLEKGVTKAADYTLYTDAAATIGYGGFFQNKWFQAIWPPELALKDNKQRSKAFLELYPIVVASMLWGSEWEVKKIMLYCDNEATVHIINKGRSQSQPIMKLMWHLTWRAAKCNFIITAKHIPGVHNDIADALCLFQISRFRHLATGAELSPCPCPIPAEVMWY